MGYQALLFCPDDKLARVVTQVFTELDFTVEPVHEPFGAVKKLMKQRYDAIVVDCENEQNASLLFKSARNSTANQSSLSIALVEGQTGVAKAYRIGANLVLTKPINVEQTKGTLRVARGLLRKQSDAAGVSSAAAVPATPAKPAPVARAGSFNPAAGGTSAIPRQLPEVEGPTLAAVPTAMPASMPALAASARIAEKPSPVPIAKTHTSTPLEAAAAERQHIAVGAATNDTVNSRAAHLIATAAAQNLSSGFASASVSAASPAPAREAPAPDEDDIAAEEAAATPHQTAAPGTFAAPSFESLETEKLERERKFLPAKYSGESSGNKKILIAAAIVLAVAALGYFGYSKFGKSATIQAPQPAPVLRSSAPPATPALAPAPPAEPATQTLAPATSANSAAASLASASASKADTEETPVDKPLLSAESSRPDRVATSHKRGTKKADAAPIHVKSNPHGGKPKAQTQGQSDDSVPPPPAVVASANDSSLSGLMTASAPALPKHPAEKLKISQGISQGLLIKRVQPKYPQAALAIHAEGAVQIEATINKEGSVTNLKVLKGDKLLAQAALAAVRQWRYKPYYLDGEPVEIQTQITINFKAN